MLYLPYHLKHNSPSGKTHLANVLEKASTFPKMAQETHLQGTTMNNFNSAVNANGCTIGGGAV
jgi:hypothetical protein